MGLEMGNNVRLYATEFVIMSGSCKGHEQVLSSCASAKASAQSGHGFGLSRIGLSIGGSICRLHLQALAVHSKVVSNQGPQQATTCLRRTFRMAITENAKIAQTVMAARGHRLEMATRLVESAVDYLGSTSGTTQVSEGTVWSYVVTHSDSCCCSS